MLRVLTLSTLYPNGAQPTLGLFVERQTRNLAARPNVELEVVAPVGLPVWPLSLHPHYRPQTALPAQEVYNGLPVSRPRFTVWPVIGQRAAAAGLANALLPLLRQIRARFPFDVIDAEYFWPDGPAAMRLSQALGVPFSVKARGSDIYLWGDEPGIDRQIRAAGEAAGGLLAVSQSLKDEMTRRGIPEDKILVHHTGVDLSMFKPVDRIEAKASLGVSGPMIVTVGALIERKGQALAIDAVAALEGTHLFLIGLGPDREALEQRAQALGIAPRVHFMGARPASEVALALAAADVMMLPTRAEGIANVWVEALACGTPVVTCDAGGVRDVIDTAMAGRVVAREAGALAAAAAEMIAEAPDPMLVRRSAERFTWERNGEALEEHLRRVAGR